MALRGSTPQEDIGRAQGKSFGNTVLRGSASAHVGDVLQGVVFEGGTHVHHYAPEPGPDAANDHLKNFGSLPVRNAVSSNDQDVGKVVSAIISALYFREADDRRVELKEAHKRTFSWIFREDASDPDHFVNWLRHGNGCFWISGKAGSGKSTLMKYIHQNKLLQSSLETWAGTKNLIVATYFFWYAGQTLQKTQEGLLRSILYQILMQRQDLASELFPDLFAHLLRRAKDGIHLHNLTLSSADLLGACDQLTKRKDDDSRLFLLVDGIDEFEGNQFDLCLFLTDFTKRPFVKMICSSRPTPECYKVFSNYRAKIRLQDLTRDDINMYIQDNLLSDKLFLERNRYERGFAKNIGDILTEKASGVFLWIVLVVRSLLSGLANYDDHETLLRKIDELPNDLEKLYDHMFSKMTDDYRREASIILQIMRYTSGHPQGPLGPLQLSIMLKDGMKCNESTYLSANAWQHEKDVEHLQVNEIEGKLRSRCCGLLEIKQPSERFDSIPSKLRIVYLHLTVHDYLCYNTIWNKVIAACPLSENVIHLALLLSNVHILSRKNLFSPLTSLGSMASADQLGRDFYMLSSLHCSDVLSKNNQSEYARYLALAEDLFLDNNWTTHEKFYLVGYLPFLRDKGFPLAGDILLRIIRCQHFFGEVDASLDTIRVFLAAWIGFAEYFRFRVGTWKQHPPIRGSLLSFTLSLATTSNDAILPGYDHVISILLDSGVDCNAKFNMKVVETLFHSSPLTDTPWRHWLLLMDANHFSKLEHWQITLRLLRAGADLSLELWSSGGLRSAYEKAKTAASQATLIDEKTVLDDIVARLAASDPKKAAKPKTSFRKFFKMRK